MAEIGDKVFAISHTSAEEKIAYTFGWGVYAGMEVPPDDLVGLISGGMNPKIDLDNGDVIWGCQCWWCSEKQGKEMLETWKEAKWEVVEVSIAERIEKWGSAA